MIMENLIKKLYEIGVVPVVKFDDAKSAVPVAKALIDGGVPCIEVTFRTDAAFDSIKNICEAYPEMLVGAGTVLTCEQVDLAIKAGVKFIVSPGLNPEVVKYCLSKNMPIMPGCTNPSDVELALSLGLKYLKFFPAEASGGVNMVKALCGPFGQVKFMPTGGVNEKNINDYLGFNKIIACGGTYLVTDDIVKNERYEEITEICKRTIKTILGLKLAHVGINANDYDDHTNVSKQLELLTMCEQKEGNSSSFVGEFEIMKEPFKGTNGHIAMSTLNVDRANAYFESKGFSFDMSTAKYKGDQLTVVYFKEEIGGFAYHLVQR